MSHLDTERPILVGAVAVAEDEIRVRGVEATVVVSGGDRDQALRLLTLLDGTRSVREVLDEAGGKLEASRDLLGALSSNGLLLDAREVWRTFHRSSSNPSPVAPSMTEDEAWLWPRWSPQAPVVREVAKLGGSAVGSIGRARQSFSRDRPPKIDPRSSWLAARVIAAASYKADAKGGRPAASAGGLAPIHLFVLGSPAEADGHVVLEYIDADLLRAAQTRVLSGQEYRALFVPDEAIDRVLAKGAATIVVAGDPTREVGKYGDRGWRYVLLEAGAVAHHCSLLAAELGVAMRAVGGYIDSALGQALDGPVPLLCLVVIAPRGGQQ